MDVESKQTIEGAIANAHQATDEVVDRVTGELAKQLAAAAEEFQRSADEVVDRIFKAANSTLAAQSGWTLMISPITISIPGITIKLSKPSETQHK